MTGDDFLWGYLPFWILNYGLAVVIWTCFGRFLLAWFVPAIQPTNYLPTRRVPPIPYLCSWICFLRRGCELLS